MLKSLLLARYTEIHNELSVKLELDEKCDSLPPSNIQVEILKPDKINVKPLDGDNGATFEFPNLTFCNLESDIALKSSDKAAVSFKLDCQRNIDNTCSIDCGCSTKFVEKIIKSEHLLCKFCSTAIAETTSIKSVKLESSDPNQLEGLHFCCSHEKEPRQPEKKDKSCCINHGHEMMIDNVCLEHQNVENKKNILTCKHCEKIVGRFDSMSQGELKLFSWNLSAELPIFDIDDDLVEHKTEPLFDDPISLVHNILTHIMLNETSRMLMIALDDRGNVITDFALIKVEWCNNFVYKSPEASINGDAKKINKLKMYEIIKVGCLMSEDEKFGELLNNEWNHDMTVLNMMLPRDMCEMFARFLKNFDEEDTYTDSEGFKFGSMALFDCAL